MTTGLNLYSSYDCFAQSLKLKKFQQKTTLSGTASGCYAQVTMVCDVLSYIFFLAMLRFYMQPRHMINIDLSIRLRFEQYR